MTELEAEIQNLLDSGVNDVNSKLEAEFQTNSTASWGEQKRGQNIDANPATKKATKVK
jgi:hypothetical protein